MDPRRAPPGTGAAYHARATARAAGDGSAGELQPRRGAFLIRRGAWRDAGRSAPGLKRARRGRLPLLTELAVDRTSARAGHRARRRVACDVGQRDGLAGNGSAEVPIAKF